jgi:hypothetical protein
MMLPGDIASLPLLKPWSIPLLAAAPRLDILLAKVEYWQLYSKPLH